MQPHSVRPSLMHVYPKHAFWPLLQQYIKLESSDSVVPWLRPSLMYAHTLLPPLGYASAGRHHD